MPKPAPQAPQKSVALYETLVATLPSVERKGAAMPYTSANGNMFSFLTPDGTLALRLPSPAREAFLARHRTKLVEQHGVVMKEYVAVPAALLAKTRELAPHFAASHAYALGLKPKATTRSAKKTAATPSRSKKKA
jgi:hypothetical protein